MWEGNEPGCSFEFMTLQVSNPLPDQVLKELLLKVGLKAADVKILASHRRFRSG